MKVRHGFVSNSSSSSFILITTKENYEKALEEATPLQKKVAKAMAEKNKFLDRGVVVFTTYSDMGGEGTFTNLDIPLEEDEMEDVCLEEVFGQFVEILNKNESEVFSQDISG